MMASEKTSVKRVRNDYEEEEDGKPKKIPRTLVEKTTGKRLIIVLENASLETVKVSALIYWRGDRQHEVRT